MPSGRLYYHLKPYLPWRFRMALRRILAKRKRKACKNVWPINEAAGLTPEGWPGWPDGKKFAFVLTHDVEGPDGLAKCRQLMQLEQELGFRSSFNFIPEGDYAVSREQREELSKNGFEVGVHDLHHDGKLYWTREIFSENAKWINHYLKEWNATGFRSGFMLHNLDWQHELGVQYDASTFDTDPFEPQPDGVGTIFPFWVPRPKSEIGSALNSQHSTIGSRPGYVELPYTLVQDSTLFLSLRETTPEIWLRKLDWIVEHGGMALLNVHPDYLRFPGEPASPRTFPVELYVQLLQYVREHYAGNYWQPLPRQLAEWYRREFPKNLVEPLNENATIKSGGPIYAARHAVHGKRAAVLLYAGIASDARPRRELEALLDEGMSVDLICLQENADEPLEETRRPLRVTRIPIRHDRFRKSGYFRNYGRFFLRSFAALTARSFTRRYDVVHVHNMPDILVFATLVPRLLGAKVILDLHDPMPELYQTIYRKEPNAGMIRLLKRLEKWSIRFASLVLTPNETFRGIFCARGCPASKIQIIMNTPDEKLFKPVQPPVETAADNPPKSEFRLMYHGLIAERHGLTTAIEAVNKLSSDFPGIVMDLFGERNVFLDQIMGTAKEMGLNGRIRYHGMRRLDDIPALIEQADLGLIPNYRTPFTEINFPTRIFEYLSMNKPVIVPDTKGIRDYFDESQILFFKPGDADDLARVIRWVHEHPAETASILKRGCEVYEQHLWSREKSRFIGSIDLLLRRKSSGSRLDYEPALDGSSGIK